jgi:lactoylglutathione lyase
MMIMKSKFAYVGIRVTDLQRSIDFYTRLLGMRVTNRGKIKQTKGETVGLASEEGGFGLELNYYEQGSPYNTKYAVGEGLDHLAFKVDDLDKALEEARSAGHRAILKIEADGGRWAYIEDPDGIWIELYQ